MKIEGNLGERKEMFNKYSLETLMKWIFMSLAISMVALTSGQTSPELCGQKDLCGRIWQGINAHVGGKGIFSTERDSDGSARTFSGGRLFMMKNRSSLSKTEIITCVFILT